jgi:hypothetical protein
MRLYVTNHGKTPALITQYHIEFSATEPKDVASKKTVTPKPGFISGPRDTPTYPLDHRFEWNGSDMFALGFVEYVDAFNKTKKSTFCCDMSDGTGRPVGGPGFNSFHSK